MPGRNILNSFFNSRTCFVAADHSFLVYMVPCHVVSAEIAVATAVQIKIPTDCEVRGVIRFLHTDEISGYLAEEASSRVELFCCNDNARPHTAGHTQILICEQFQWKIFEHPPYSPDLAPSDFFVFPN